MDSPPASGTWAQRGWKRALIDWFPLGLILVAYLVSAPARRRRSPRSRTCSRSSGSTSGCSAARHRRCACNASCGTREILTGTTTSPRSCTSVTSWCRSSSAWCCGSVRIRCSAGSAPCSSRVTFAGFATYVLYPAIPPWLASRRGDMPHVVRIVRAMWLHLGVSGRRRRLRREEQVRVPGRRAALAARGVAVPVDGVPLAGRGPLAGAAGRVRARHGVHPRLHRPTTSCSTCCSGGPT